MIETYKSETDEVLAVIGWTSGELARRLGVAENSAGQWRSGRRKPPPSVIDWLWAIARAVEQAAATTPAGF